jgi:hypothetical protein
LNQGTGAVSKPNNPYFSPPHLFTSATPVWLSIRKENGISTADYHKSASSWQDPYYG